jgi:ribonuclease HII
MDGSKSIGMGRCFFAMAAKGARCGWASKFGSWGEGMAELISPPTLTTEAALWARGYRVVAGLDEAGRGALAGPVVAAAVVVPPGSACDGVWAAVRDSKLLTPQARAGLMDAIQAAALTWGVGVVEAAAVDRMGIAPATRAAMRAALAQLAPPADHLLIDWVRLPETGLPQVCLPKGDQRMVSVAAASILAKVSRDRLLVELAQTYPGYGLDAHKGYGTRNHLAALQRLGPTPIHRHSFAPVAGLPLLAAADDA